jgi:hypothetical protein
VSAAVTPRRFPPPSVGAVFVVKDGTGQQLAYVYFEEVPERRSAAKLFSKDEALARLPELLCKYVGACSRKSL